MALIEMDFATGIGEHYEETVLWTNPNPYTTSYAGGTVTLSDDYANYDYLKFVFYRNTINPELLSVIYKSEDFATFKYGNVDPAAQMGILAMTATSNASVFFYRSCYPASNNQITITKCLRNNTTTEESNNIIPYRILGLKKVGGSGGNVPITDISVVGKTLLGTITTAGGTYIATEDCLMAGKATGSGSAYAYVMFDGIEVFNSTNSVGLIGYSASNVSSPDTYGLFVPKGTVVSTRSSGTYSLYFYSLK